MSKGQSDFEARLNELGGTIPLQRNGNAWEVKQPEEVVFKEVKVPEVSSRFSDAELSAEVHRASAEVYRAKVHGLNPDGLIDRFMILTRFASLPHFDEVDC